MSIEKNDTSNVIDHPRRKDGFLSSAPLAKADPKRIAGQAMRSPYMWSETLSGIAALQEELTGMTECGFVPDRLKNTVDVLQKVLAVGAKNVDAHLVASRER